MENLEKRGINVIGKCNTANTSKLSWKKPVLLEEPLVILSLDDRRDYLARQICESPANGVSFYGQSPYFNVVKIICSFLFKKSHYFLTGRITRN